MASRGAAINHLCRFIGRSSGIAPKDGTADQVFGRALTKHRPSSIPLPAFRAASIPGGKAALQRCQHPALRHAGRIRLLLDLLGEADGLVGGLPRNAVVDGLGS